MPEFIKAITEAIATAQTALDRARAEGDVDEVIVHQGRLEELHRIAHENGVPAA